LAGRIAARLPFALTAGQGAALRTISARLHAAGPSAFLLQGDVGCGKTLVALLAAAPVVEAGEQVAFMVPTELLARQHFASACRILAPLGIGVGLLTGAHAARAVAADAGSPGDGQPVARGQLLTDLGRGAIGVLFGTHALLREQVAFAGLGLVVIDEQHRFGVLQRRHLLEREPRADLLLMTATPIPRSLAMTVYGDLERTVIAELPPGRRPVRTHLVRLANVGRVYDRVRAELAAGGQAYVVAPRIAAAAQPAAAAPVAVAAEPLFATLRDTVFPQYSCGLIHGAMSELDKHAVMEAFRGGALSILVATTVVEVGVDVVDATCIVVFGAERFGLATLHQLRGRVGRGVRQGYAFLVYGEPLSEAGTGRLRAMKASTDGFEIAEHDLGLRGPGQLLGLRQAGLPELRVAELPRDLPLALRARAEIAHPPPGAATCA
jgi:ATP-dependent DNA helicase RecG